MVFFYHRITYHWSRVYPNYLESLHLYPVCFLTYLPTIYHPAIDNTHKLVTSSFRTNFRPRYFLKAIILCPSLNVMWYWVNLNSDPLINTLVKYLFLSWEASFGGFWAVTPILVKVERLQGYNNPSIRHSQYDVGWILKFMRITLNNMLSSKIWNRKLKAKVGQEFV